MQNLTYSSDAPAVAAGSASRLRTLILAAAAALFGLALAICWNYEIADTVIGANIARTIMGQDAKAMALSGETLVGILFAFASGMAATFTACNCVVFSCVIPMVAEQQSSRTSILRLVGWMVLGVVVVTACYGALGVLLGGGLPILSAQTLPFGSRGGFPVRLAQSSLVFVLLGAVLVWWGLCQLGLARSPLPAQLSQRPWFTPLALGILIGGFSVGRPFPLFRKTFEYAIATGDPLFSAGAMVLQGLGNIAVMLVALLLTLLLARRAAPWLRERADLLRRVAGASLIIGGVFFLMYWGVRLPSLYGIGWFPASPWR